MNTGVTPNQAQLRAIRDNRSTIGNSNEVLYTVSPFTNMWENSSQASNHTYKIRELNLIPLDTGILTGSGPLTIEDAAKN